jgi:hypothetical protein
MNGNATNGHANPSGGFGPSLYDRVTIIKLLMDVDAHISRHLRLNRLIKILTCVSALLLHFAATYVMYGTAVLKAEPAAKLGIMCALTSLLIFFCLIILNRDDATLKMYLVQRITLCNALAGITYAPTTYDMNQVLKFVGANIPARTIPANLMAVAFKKKSDKEGDHPAT